jgi:hypothetical protein
MRTLSIAQTNPDEAATTTTTTIQLIKSSAESYYPVKGNRLWELSLPENMEDGSIDQSIDR